VVDDGSTDTTVATVRAGKPDWRVPVQCLTQQHRGPAAARNLGVRSAIGEIVLFTGDDMFLRPDAVGIHLATHTRFPETTVGVLGTVEWRPPVTELKRWLHDSGIQFAYGCILSEWVTDFRFFYTSNLSLKRRFLLEHGLFDEAFPYAACEDLELGLRLMRRGLRLRYDPTAVALHDHEVSFRNVCERGRIVGRSLMIFAGLHRELRGELLRGALPPTPLNHLVRSGLELGACFSTRLKRRYWMRAFRMAQAVGMADARGLTDNA
jgi:GT2 family glycosyltransferase